MNPHRPKSTKKKRSRHPGSPAPAGRPRPKQRQLTVGEWFEKLVALQARLRAPDGCPWDREQTHTSLRTYLLEETYEVLEALEAGDDAKFAEEMGDLLLQIVFHAQIAAEERRFTAVDVIREIHDKMVRRHPHVFGKVKAGTAKEVLKNWEQLKVEERQAGRPAGVVDDSGNEADAQPASLLDGLPKNAPAALEAYQLSRRAARIGFDWDSAKGILDKWREEAAELQHALQANDAARIEEEAGDLLFVAANLARFLHVDPEIALKKANQKFAARFRLMEKVAAGRGKRLAELPRGELESLWETAKRGARGPAAGRGHSQP